MQRIRRYIAAVATTLLFAITATAPASADDRRDHDLARQALQAGEILPLRMILERVERAHPGQIMEVELERKDGTWIYEIKMLRPNGALVKLKVNARDGALLDGGERGAVLKKNKR